MPLHFPPPMTEEVILIGSDDDLDGLVNPQQSHQPTPPSITVLSDHDSVDEVIVVGDTQSFDEDARYETLESEYSSRPVSQSHFNGLTQMSPPVRGGGGRGVYVPSSQTAFGFSSPCRPSKEPQSSPHRLEPLFVSEAEDEDHSRAPPSSPGIHDASFVSELSEVCEVNQRAQFRAPPARSFSKISSPFHLDTLPVAPPVVGAGTAFLNLFLHSDSDSDELSLVNEPTEGLRKQVSRLISRQPPVLKIGRSVSLIRERPRVVNLETGVYPHKRDKQACSTGKEVSFTATAPPQHSHSPPLTVNHRHSPPQHSLSPPQHTLSPPQHRHSPPLSATLRHSPPQHCHSPPLTTLDTPPLIFPPSTVPPFPSTAPSPSGFTSDFDIDVVLELEPTRPLPPPAATAPRVAKPVFTPKDLARANRLNRTREELMREMHLHVEDGLHTSLSQPEPLERVLRFCQVTHSPHPHPVIRWLRTCTALYDSAKGMFIPCESVVVPEAIAVIYLAAVDFAERLTKHALAAVVKELRADGVETVVIMVEGYDVYLQKLRTKENREYQTMVRMQIGEDLATKRKKPTPRFDDHLLDQEVECLVHQLVVNHRVNVFPVKSKADALMWITTFTYTIASGAYDKSERYQDLAGVGTIRSGTSPSDTYVQSLQQLKFVTAPVSTKIRNKYDSMYMLYRAVNVKNGLGRGADGKPLTRETISRCLTTLFSSTDPHAILEE